MHPFHIMLELEFPDLFMQHADLVPVEYPFVVAQQKRDTILENRHKGTYLKKYARCRVEKQKAMVVRVYMVYRDLQSYHPEKGGNQEDKGS